MNAISPTDHDYLIKLCLSLEMEANEMEAIEKAAVGGDMFGESMGILCKKLRAAVAAIEQLQAICEGRPASGVTSRGKRA